MKEHTTTQPVILIGVEPKELKGFNKIEIQTEKEKIILEGSFTIQMVNESLKITSKPLQEKDMS